MGLDGASLMPPSGAAVVGDWAGFAARVIHGRHTVMPKRLVAPGPRGAELAAILGAAAAAPDHRQLLPWRLVEVPLARRADLADLFAHALLARDADATLEQQAQAREKAFRAPSLFLLVVDEACGDPGVDLTERLISAGCAVQNVLLMATAMGYGSALTSGKALKSPVFRKHFGLSQGAQAVCFISLGSVAAERPARPRPALADYWSVWGAPASQPPGAGGD